jgi:hypothetical protein
MSTVHVFCPLCNIGSPRERHELASVLVICTVCGRRLTQEAIDSALGRRRKREEPMGPNESDQLSGILPHWWSMERGFERPEMVRGGS